jgi:hypothetical protein
LYDKAPLEPEQELNAFDKIAKKLRNYTQLASQDEFEDYCSRELYDIRKLPVLK